MIVSGYPGVFGENRNKLVNEWVGDLVYEVAISTEVIFRAHRILVRRTEVYFRGNNLIYWFVHTEVQLPCGLTALAGYRYGSFKTVRIAINWIVNFSSGRLISASLLDYDTVYEHPGAAAMQIDKGFWCSTYKLWCWQIYLTVQQQQQQPELTCVISFCVSVSVP